MSLDYFPWRKKTKFSQKTIDTYEDEKSLLKLNDFVLNKSFITENQKKHILNKLPYWYLRICAKQIILRDINIYKIFSSIFHLKEVFSLIKGSSNFAKLLVMIESSLNILWFSLVRILRKKGAGKNRYADEY